MKFDYSWQEIFVLSFMISVIKVIFSMTLSNMAPVGKENPSSLVQGGYMAFWHLVYTQSQAMNPSILYDTFVLVACFGIGKQLSNPRSNVNSLLRSF